MCQNRFQPFAPSSEAASWRSVLIVCSPARSVMAKNGMPAPRVDHDRAPERPGRRWTGTGSFASTMKPRLVEGPVEDAEGRVEHPAPREGREHGGNDERKQHGRPDQALAAEMPVQQDREPHAERELADRRAERVEGRVPGRLLEDRVVPRLDEVLEPNELGRVPTLMLESESHTPITNGYAMNSAQQHDGRDEQEGEGQERSFSRSRASARRCRASRGSGERDLDTGGSARPLRRSDSSSQCPAVGPRRRSSSARPRPTSRRPRPSCPARPWRTCRR